MARFPLGLTHRPFTLDEARAAGLNLEALKGKSWRRLARGLYCWANLAPDPMGLLLGWQRLLSPRVVYAGRTAAWLFGMDLDPLNPVEVIAPSRCGIKSRPGLAVRHCRLLPGDVVEVRGLPATGVQRTLRDLCLRFPPVEALVAIDAAVRLGLADVRQMTQPRRLRLLAEIAAPAESPMETRLRWLLLQAGLPQPEVQTNLQDSKGRFVGRADLFYPTARLVIEYDGANHRERLVEDNRRQNSLVNAGFRLLRFTAADVHQRPKVVTAQVAELLHAANHRGQPSRRRRHEDVPGVA